MSHEVKRPPKTITLYFYRPEKDFSVPENMGNRLIPLLRSIHLEPFGFHQVPDPMLADLLVFPYYLEQYTDHHRISGLWEFISSLPYFRQRETAHLFFSDHDSSAPYVTSSIWLRASVSRRTRDPYSYPLPYLVEDLAAFASPERFCSLSSHTSFVGYQGFSGERLPLLQGIAAEPRLIAHLDVTDGFHDLQSEEIRQIRRMRYLDSLANSLTVLCPRGDGENSIRFFETLAAGRIPVLVADTALLPLEDQISYDNCLLRISNQDAKQAGTILYSWLAAQTDQQLEQRCRLARSIWEAWFSPEGVCRLISQILQHHAATQRPPAIQHREDPPASTQLASQAHLSFSAGHYQQAEQLLYQAIRLNPRDGVLYNDLGVVLAQQGNRAEAIKAFHTAISYDIRLFWAYLNLGDLLAADGDTTEAVNCYRKAAAVDQSSDLPHKRLQLAVSAT